MKAVRFYRTGGPEVLVFEEVPDPVAAPGQVLVRVEASGVNFSDVLRRRGDAYPEASPTPFTLGAEIAGTVVAHGEGIDLPALGSLVFATPRHGGYAQLMALPAASVIAVPDGITAAEATTLVIQGLTAAFALRDAGRLRPGESVFVEAAAGGVGSFAIQLAKLFGAGLVIAGASSAEKRAFALSLGADAAVDYTDPVWAAAVIEASSGRGVDIVLEMTGGETLPRALEALSPYGRMVVYGLASGQTVQVDPQHLVQGNQAIRGLYIGGYFASRPAMIRETLREIVGYVKAGQLSLQVGSRLPLSQAAEAHALLEGRRSTGKIVLEPWA